MVADVSKLEDVQRFFAAVAQRFGAVHILINNAYGMGGYLPECHAELDSGRSGTRMIGLNLTGAYYCCHEILPIFRSRAKVET